MNLMIDITHLLQLHNYNIINWHIQLQKNETELPWTFIEENNQFKTLSRENFKDKYILSLYEDSKKIIWIGRSMENES